ncbi:DUF6056 family protein, partial [Candidatus Saccharibacteria bacterium]|nr:DUF6056 family protein [Candidatus Saccharibacteria bacterium]
FALLGGYYGVALIRGKKQNTPYLKDRFAGMVGVVLGFLFFWVLGDGWGATVLRSDRGYGGSISISSIFSEPLVAIPQFMANFAGNISDYLPYLILAVIGCALLKRYKRTEGAELDLAVVALIFAVIYITGLSSMPNIMNRFSVMAFMSLMIPIAQGLPIVFARGKVAGALQLGVMLLVMVGMTVDNTLFSANNYKKTRAAVIEVKEKNCIDAAMVKDASLPTRSRIFGFRHSETAFTHLVLNGQGKYYNLDGKRIPIKDNCQLD